MLACLPKSWHKYSSIYIIGNKVVKNISSHLAAAYTAFLFTSNPERRLVCLQVLFRGIKLRGACHIHLRARTSTKGRRDAQMLSKGKLLAQGIPTQYQVDNERLFRESPSAQPYGHILCQNHTRQARAEHWVCSCSCQPEDGI